MQTTGTIPGTKTGTKQVTAAGADSRKKHRHMLQLPIQEQLSHGRQVSNLAYETAREMGLSEEECRDLVIAGFFHDIGKIELQTEERVLSDKLIVDR